MKIKSRGKLALIPVLAAVLFYVLRNGNEAVEVELTSAPPAAGKRQPLTSQQPAPLNISLNSVHLDEVLTLNPFARSPTPGPTSDQSSASGLNGDNPQLPSESLVVEAIMSHGREPRAVINGKIVAVGDVLADGRRVLHITPTHIKVTNPTSR